MLKPKTNTHRKKSYELRTPEYHSGRKCKGRLVSKATSINTWFFSFCLGDICCQHFASIPTRVGAGGKGGGGERHAQPPCVFRFRLLRRLRYLIPANKNPGDQQKQNNGTRKKKRKKKGGRQGYDSSRLSSISKGSLQPATYHSSHHHHLLPAAVAAYRQQR